jgi:integrase
MGEAAEQKPTRRINLNDRILRALPAPADGKPYDIRDTVVPGLRVRVMGGGQRSFVLLRRYPGSQNATRRAIGKYGAITLADARRKAQKWLDLLGSGIDPKEQEQRQRLAEQHNRKNTFAAVAEDFIAEKLPDERKGREVERDIRRQFMPAWGGLPITEVTDAHVLTLIKAKKRTAPAQARNLLGTAKRLFSWAVDQRCYGLVVSPCGSLKPSAIVGEKRPRSRLLSDEEMFALWRAAERMKYPHGPVYQFLMLTALRLNEVADAHWSEFDLANKLWIIPAQRMKAKESKARPHTVPLTDELMAILENLPRFNRGKFVFSTMFGEKPAWISDKIKNKIDARMLPTLRALARKRGEDARAVELTPWVNHDIRRTLRTNFSRLKVAEEAREAVMAHVRPGIKGTCDLHTYDDEKREVLELWAGRLGSIVEPPPANVVELQARA